MISLFPPVSSVTLDWVLAKLFSVGAAAANCWGSRLQNEKGFRGGVSCDTEGAPPSFHDALRFLQVSDGRTSDALRLYCNRIFFFSGKLGHTVWCCCSMLLIQNRSLIILPPGLQWRRLTGLVIQFPENSTFIIGLTASCQWFVMPSMFRQRQGSCKVVSQG